MNHLALTSYLGTLAEVGFVNEFRQVVPTRTTNITTIEVGDTSKISGDETGADIAEEAQSITSRVYGRQNTPVYCLMDHSCS